MVFGWLRVLVVLWENGDGRKRVWMAWILFFQRDRPYEQRLEPKSKIKKVRVTELRLDPKIFFCVILIPSLRGHNVFGGWLNRGEWIRTFVWSFCNFSNHRESKRGGIESQRGKSGMGYQQIPEIQSQPELPEAARRNLKFATPPSVKNHACGKHGEL